MAGTPLNHGSPSRAIRIGASFRSDGTTGISRKIVYPWMQVVFGNPKQTLAALDLRREEILANVPEKVEQIPDGVVCEWMALVKERNRTLREILLREKIETMNGRVFQIYGLLNEMESKEMSLLTTTFPALAAAYHEIRAYLIRSELPLKVLSKENPSTVAVQADFQDVKFAAPSSPPLLLGDLDVPDIERVEILEDLDVETEWKPTAASTPFAKKPPQVENRFCSGIVAQDVSTNRASSGIPDVGSNRGLFSPLKAQNFAEDLYNISGSWSSTTRTTVPDNGELNRTRSMPDMEKVAPAAFPSLLHGNSNSQESIRSLSTASGVARIPKNLLNFNLFFVRNLLEVDEIVLTEKPDHNDSVD